MKNSTVSFKENIRRMYLRHTIIPVIGIALFCLCAFIFTWTFILLRVNRQSNEKVGNAVESTIDAYRILTEELDDQKELVRNAGISSNQARINEKIYDTANQTGYKAEILIYDESCSIVMSSGSVENEYLNGQIFSDWAIFRLMQEHTDKVSIRIINDGRSEALLCIGKPICENDRICNYIVFVIKASEFSVLMSEVTVQTIIADSRGWIFASNNYALVDNLGRLDRSLDDMSRFINYNKKFYFITSTSYQDADIRVCSITELNQELPLLGVMFCIIIIIFMAMIIMTYISSGRLAERSTKDIYTISDAFDKVMEGNLDTELDIHGSVEFQRIGEAYNMMLQSLKEQIQHNREMVENVAIAQIKQLESQFNPHFLYNTLDNIRYVCLVDPKEAEKMIISLSSLLRYSINTNEEETTVSEDMQYTRNYLHILTIRFHQRLTYTLDINEDIYQAVIPKLLLQPLIENAIKYGFNDRETLHIKVSGFEENGRLKFICKDDGSGIAVPELNKLRHLLNAKENNSGHSGLYNINRRIKLKFGTDGEYGVSIDSEKGKGTEVVIILPWL